MVEKDILYFAPPKKVMLPKDLMKSPPPSSSGIYGWYFDFGMKKVPPYVPTTHCTTCKTGRWWCFKRYWMLLYIGKASNLRERIVDEHLLGNPVRGKTISSFRQTVGCLLCKKLRINLWKYPDFPRREYTFSNKGEQKLTNWMWENIGVAWVETENIDEMEIHAIASYVLPLNTARNKHWFIEPLKALKKDLRGCAPFSGGKRPRGEVRRAYKKFKRLCKKRLSGK